MKRLELALWLTGIVIAVVGLIMGGIVLHRALVDQAQQQLTHSLRHVCQQNPLNC